MASSPAYHRQTSDFLTVIARNPQKDNSEEAHRLYSARAAARPEELRHVPRMDIEDAALLVLEAMEGVRHDKPLPHPISRKCHHLSLNMRIFSILAIVGLIILTFVEIPRWCQNFPDKPCIQEDRIIPYIPVLLARQIEMCLGAVLLVDYILIALAYRRNRAVFKSHTALVVVYLLDILVAVLDGHERNWRIAPYTRAIFLFLYFPVLRDQLKLFRTLLVDFVSTLTVLALYVSFFGFLGMVTFTGTEHEKYFNDFSDASWSVLVMLTTCNFPDVILPEFTAVPLSAVFFIPVVIVGVFVLMNFVLASVYDKYQQVNKDLLDQMLRIREENCDSAFDLLDLDEDGTIGSHTMEELLDEIELCTSKNKVQKLDRAQRLLFFQLVDSNGDKGINKEEFKAVITLLQLRFERVEEQTFMELWFPAITFSSWFEALSDIVEHRGFEYFIDAVLLFNTVLIVQESGASVEGDEESTSFGEDINGYFGMVYCAEMFLKILVFGWKGYWSTYRNVFDGTITLGGIITRVMLRSTLGNIFNSHHLITCLVAFRLLRVARLMMAVPQLRIVIATIGNIAPETLQYLVLLFITMFTYCVLGVHLYGGVLVSTPDVPLDETDYGQNGYWPFNFNSMGSGMALLFCLLVLNNWMVFVGAIVAAMDGNRWHRWYFVSFYLVGVLIMLNVLVAVVLDNFLLEWSKRRTAEDRPVNVSVRTKHDSIRAKEGISSEDGKMKVPRFSRRNSMVEFKVKLANSVKMIEQKEVLERFMNLHGVTAVSRDVNEGEQELDMVAQSTSGATLISERKTSFAEPNTEETSDLLPSLGVQGIGRSQRTRKLFSNYGSTLESIAAAEDEESGGKSD